MDISQKDIERFWSKIKTVEGDNCHEWLDGLNSGGYGSFWCNDKSYRANRIVWELTYGPIPDGKLILHKCDNRKCCNIEHLYCGTYQDNRQDINSRHRVLANIYGTNHAKLYEGEIWLIRRLKVPLQNPTKVRKYKFSANLVAKMFKVNHHTILSIWSSNSWLCKEGYYA